MLERDTLFRSMVVSGCCATPSGLDLIWTAHELHVLMLLLSSLSPTGDFPQGRRKRQKFVCVGSEQGRCHCLSLLAEQSPLNGPEAQRPAGDGRGLSLPVATEGSSWWP